MLKTAPTHSLTGAHRCTLRGFTGIELLVVMSILSVLGGGTAVAADKSKPGDALFGLDLALERVQERLVSNPIRQLELKVKHAQEREAELNELAQEARQDSTSKKTENLVQATNLTNQALQQAEQTVSKLAESVSASEQSHAQEALQKVSHLLQELQVMQQEHLSRVEEIKAEVKDGEIKQKISAAGAVGQVIKSEERVDQKTGIKERRIKVYQANDQGEEVKILDIREKDGKVEVETHKTPDGQSEKPDSLGGKEHENEVSHTPRSSNPTSSGSGKSEDSDQDESESDSSFSEANEKSTPTPSQSVASIQILTPTKSLNSSVSTKPSETPKPTEADERNHGHEAKEADTVEINWKDGGFEPQTVSVALGGQVEFKNKDDTTIRIASDPHPVHTDLPDLDSGNLAKGEEYKYTFWQAGTWGVHNHFDPAQTATIIVQ